MGQTCPQVFSKRGFLNPVCEGFTEMESVNELKIKNNKTHEDTAIERVEQQKQTSEIF